MNNDFGGLGAFGSAFRSTLSCVVIPLRVELVVVAVLISETPRANSLDENLSAWRWILEE
jgi:hypothetical protein